MDNEPTIFGPVTAVLSANHDGWQVKLSNRFRRAPEHIVIPVPWFYELRQVQADGRTIEATEGKLILSPNTQEVKVTGRIKAGTEAYHGIEFTSQDGREVTTTQFQRSAA